MAVCMHNRLYDGVNRRKSTVAKTGQQTAVETAAQMVVKAPLVDEMENWDKVRLCVSIPVFLHFDVCSKLGRVYVAQRGIFAVLRCLATAFNSCTVSRR